MNFYTLKSSKFPSNVIYTYNFTTETSIPKYQLELRGWKGLVKVRTHWLPARVWPAGAAAGARGRGAARGSRAPHGQQLPRDRGAALGTAAGEGRAEEGVPL